MSTTDTDFWSRIDSASSSDEPSQPSLAIDSPSADDDSSRGETASEELPRDGDVPPTAAPQREVSEPELSQPEVSRPAAAAPQKSKSQRIREFMDAHPEVRNRDIVDALGEHGVTAADVSNVRTQLRKKAEKQQRAKSRVEASAGPPAESQGTAAPQETRAGRGTRGTRKTNRGMQAGERATASASARSGSAQAPAGEIAMAEIEAGLSFIEQAGSIERARQVVDLIARIRNVSLTR